MPLLCDPIYVPLHLVSESNQREHWGAKSRRVRAQRRAVYLTLRSVYGPPPPLPLRVTLHRVAPRPLDDDNCVASLKACADGVSDWLCGIYGAGQDRQEGLTWTFGQHRGHTKEYALQIILERSAPDVS